jgi:transposase
MKYFSLHSVPPDGIEVLKKLFVKYLKHNMSIADISRHLEVKISCLYNWQKNYKQNPADFLKRKPRGPKPGDDGKNGRKLKREQENIIKSLICSHQPTDQECGAMDSCCWDRKTILRLIEHKFGITMSLTTLTRYLKQWDFTPKKPVKKAHEQNIKLVEEFKEVTFPAIVKKCDKDEGVIVMLDETGFHSDSNVCRSYSPRGVKAESDLSARRYARNVVISISKELGLNFMSYDTSFNTDMYIKYLQRLINIANGRKIFLIADNLRVHHSKKLMAWIKGKEHLIELHYFPSYSPNLNPVEYINHYIKWQIYSKSPMRSQAALNKRVRSELRSLQRNLKLARRFFDHKELKFMQNILPKKFLRPHLAAI